MIGLALLLVPWRAAAADLGPAARANASALPFWKVAVLTGDAFGCLAGTPETAVELLACDETCRPIPWQLDERNPDGERALGAGPAPTFDDPPGIIDPNDELLWMAADAGRPMRPEEAPPALCARTFSVRAGDATGWVYAFVVTPPARRSPVRYVEYDPATDRVDAGRVAVGFGAPTARYLAVRSATTAAFGPNLLDRLKVRASARFFGIIPLGRDEDDIQWIFDAWHAGPIRVVRRERQWVRLAWNLRTPIFRTESIVTRDTLELPVRLRLNFPPSYFFAGIEVQAALDFRDLGGWTVSGPAAGAHRVGSAGAAAALDDVEGDWLALAGPDVTVVLRLQLGESFASLRRSLLYREEDGDDGAPESVPGERPAAGFRLTEWGDVDRGHHWFAAIATALPAGADVPAFLRQDAAPLIVDASGPPTDGSSVEQQLDGQDQQHGKADEKPEHP